MRRLLLVLPLALVVLAVSAASASAATVSGACTVSGSADFTPNGLQVTPQSLFYSFNGTGTCSGTLDGAPITNAPVSAFATGGGTLSCAGALSLGGIGHITFPNQGVTINFGINLVGAGSEVEFALTGNGGGGGGGHATFASNADRALECNNPTGVNDLGFEIQAAAANLTG